MLVAEEKRRAPRKALEEPDKGRALTARQKKALGAMARSTLSRDRDRREINKDWKDAERKVDDCINNVYKIEKHIAVRLYG